MKVIENGLISVYENERQEQLVTARELWEGLGVKQEFSNWIKQSLKNVDAVQGIDFTSFDVKEQTPTTWINKKEYILQLDTAKEILMIAGTSNNASAELKEKSKKYRKYLIGVEKKVKQKQFESIDHFKKEQMMLEFTMDKLKINDGSKIKMIKEFNKVHNLSTEYLPDYTEEKVTKSLSELLTQYEVGITAVKINQLLIRAGILEERERPSTSKGTKKYKALTENGLKYGKNLISSHGSQRETQPHYYEDTFEELLELIKELKQEAC